MRRTNGDDLARPRRQSGRDRAATAAYIEKMAKELKDLARRDGFPTLAYLLDVARLEAALKAVEALDAVGSRPVAELPKADPSA